MFGRSLVPLVKTRNFGMTVKQASGVGRQASDVRRQENRGGRSQSLRMESMFGRSLVPLVKARDFGMTARQASDVERQKSERPAFDAWA